MSFTTLLAHADLVERDDVPVPEWVFAWGAALVLIITFVALTVLWREPRLEDDRWRPAPGWLSGVLAGGPARFLAGLIGVALLVVTVYTGLKGTESPDRNFSITFIFMTVWLGMVVVSVFLGDLFRAFNPWAAIARAFSKVFALIAGQPGRAPLAYPERLGRWPAAVALVAFVWLEFVYGQSGFGSVGIEPRIIALAVLLYSVYTLTGMLLFGIDRWLERGELFSVYFGMFASLAKLEVRDGRLGVRRWLSGARVWAAGIAGSAAMVVTTIGGTVYDGAREGVLAGVIAWMRDGFVDIGLSPVFSHRLAGTILLAATVLLVGAIFYAGIAGMRTAGGRLGEMSTPELARTFAFSFIPIGFAYLVAHYFTYVVFLMQAQFTYLINDPLGDGSNLFGIDATQIDYEVISADPVFVVQVAALVIGHAVALVMAHDRAVAMFGDSRVAARSQYWMLALMVCFTTLGLFLVSEANA